jgi:hypothetical protein
VKRTRFRSRWSLKATSRALSMASPISAKPSDTAIGFGLIKVIDRFVYFE